MSAIQRSASLVGVDGHRAVDQPEVLGDGRCGRRCVEGGEQGDSRVVRDQRTHGGHEVLVHFRTPVDGGLEHDQQRAVTELGEEELPFGRVLDRFGHGANSSARIRSATVRIVWRSRHRRALDEGERVVLGEAVLVHQQALGPVDQLAGLELLLEACWPGRAAARISLEAAERHLDRRQEVGALERLDEVGQRAGVAGLLDEVALAERGEDQHRGPALAGDLACGRRARRARAS